MARRVAENAALALGFYNFLLDKEVRVLATRLGYSPSTVYGWAENASQMPAHVVPRLIDVTNDLEGVAKLLGLEERGIVCLRREQGEATQDKLAVAALKISAEVGDVSRTVTEAISDGVVDELERARIEKELRDLRKRTAQLEQLLAARGAVIR